MGLFDKFKKKPEETVNEEGEKRAETVGWNAIESAFEKIYPGQKNPKHYGTLISWRFGGNDPLDGISIYEADEYWHFVTYGLSELYEKQSEDKGISGFGMEFTLKLKKDSYDDEEAEIRCICGVLQSIARITFSKGEIFKAFEYLYTGQKEGMDANRKSNITGFITVSEPKIEEIDTPNGKVKFVEMIGVTDNELQKIISKEIDVKELYSKLGNDITDYNRASIY